MRDLATFEHRLADAFERYADLAPVEVDRSITQPSDAAMRRLARPLFSLPISSRRAIAVATLGVLLLAGIAAALLMAGSLQRHGPLPGRFTPTGPMLFPSDGTAIAQLSDGRVLVIGSVASLGLAGASPAERGELFDPATGTFALTSGAMTEPRFSPTATTLRDGTVLIAGGERAGIDGGATSVATTERFNPTTGTFATSGAMAIARSGHTATPLVDGRILVVGGETFTDGASVPATSAEMFDPATGTWSSLEGPAWTSGHTATLLADGRVLITGGRDAESMDPTTVTAIFDPSSNAFIPGPRMRAARTAHSTTLLTDGRVLIAGGYDPASVPTAELYDPQTNAFSSTGSLTTERSGHSATLLADGRVLVAGGDNLRGNVLGTELYDPATGQFVLGAPAGGPLGRLAARLADGRTLVIGEQPELFDLDGTTPAATPRDRTDGVFAETGAPVADRYGHTATLLADGRVLIVGGFLAEAGRMGDAPTATAEIFDPTTATFASTGSIGLPTESAGLGARLGHGVVTLPDGRVLFFGGNHYSWELQAYDPLSGMFSSAGALGDGGWTVRQRIIPVQVEGGGLVVVGQPISGSSSDDAKVYRLDQPAMVLTEVGSIPGCAGAHDAIAASGHRLVVLCWHPDTLSAPVENASVHAFDLQTGTSVRLELPVADPWGALLGLADGRVLVASGTGTTHLTLLDADTLEPRDAGTVATTALDVTAWPQLEGITLTQLRDGRVLILGGDDATVWDPGTGATGSLPGPLTALNGHTATLLDGGRVLVVGGTTWPADRNLPIPPGAEIFDPNAVR